jgi:hypothetical protein
MSAVLAAMFTALAAASLAWKTGGLYWFGYAYALMAVLYLRRMIQLVRRRRTGMG